MTTNTNITIHYGLTNSYTDITDIVFSTQPNISGIIKIPAAESDRQLAFNGFMSGFENQIFIIQNGITTIYDNTADIYIDTTDNNAVLPVNILLTYPPPIKDSPPIVSEPAPEPAPETIPDITNIITPALETIPETIPETTNIITPAPETIPETANTITPASETIPETTNTITSASETIPAPISDV